MNYNSVAYMSDAFETRKNAQATMITLGVAGLLLLIFFLVKFEFPVSEQPVFDQVFEVNLGTSEQGSGKDQPQLPGEPAPSQQLAYNPPTAIKAVDNNAKEIETSDKNKDAPEITKPTVTKTTATKIDRDNKTVKTNPKPQEVITPLPPRPKAVLGKTVGGNGNGGNGADTYKKGSNEGIAGGNGDQGRPNGTPGATNYSGPVKSFGVKVLQISNQSFEDEFNENAKVAMDVVADGRGKVLSASFQPRGSTTSNRKLIDIAERRAFELKLAHLKADKKELSFSTLS